MRRVLFTVAGRPIYSYAAMLYLGIVLGIYAQLYAGLAVGLSPGRLLACTIVLLAAALLGARLLFVASNWSAFRQQPARILRMYEGGASMYGGLLVAVPLSLPITRAFGLPFATFWDTASFTMLVGMIVTRAGCFLNGCCAGRPSASRWAWYLPNDRGIWTRRVPTQVLEALWGALVLSGAVAVWRQRAFDGAVILYTIGAYGTGRLILEGAREVQDRLAGVRVQRALSAMLVVIALSGFGLVWLQR